MLSLANDLALAKSFGVNGYIKLQTCINNTTTLKHIITIYNQVIRDANHVREAL